jgi:U3 small nucleolar RNA-associated protein 23
MRHGRAKAARRTLQFLARTQQYKPPYHVLLDGTFCVAAIRMKILVIERLTRLLQLQESEKIRLYVTQSTLDELKTLADQAKKQQEYFQQAYDWTQNYAEVVSKLPSTNTEKEDVSLSATAQDLFRLLVSEDESSLKYFLASQDEQLLHAARSHAVPCIRLARTVLLLEQPSKMADRQDKGVEKRKWKDSVPEAEKELVNMVRKEKKQQQTQPQGGDKQRAKKKAKGPNPLSCKSKKHAKGDDEPSHSAKRRKRNKEKSLGGES